MVLYCSIENLHVENCEELLKTKKEKQSLCLMSFFPFRVKALVLCLCPAMLALTVCLTSWSTSLSITASASTFCVLVSMCLSYNFGLTNAFLSL